MDTHVSQLSSPRLYFSALGTAGMQAESYTDPPACRQHHVWARLTKLAGPGQYLRSYWDVLVLGHHSYLLCLGRFCSPYSLLALKFANSVWLSQGCRVNQWNRPNLGLLPHGPGKLLRISHTNWELHGAPYSMHWCGIQLKVLLLLLLYCACDLKILGKENIFNPFTLCFPISCILFLFEGQETSINPKRNTNLKYQTQTCRPEQMLATHWAVASGYI